MKSPKKDRFVLEFIIFCILLAIIAGILFFISKKAQRSVPSAKNVFQRSIRSVLIDAGHGGEDGGAIGINGILEKDVNLDLSNDLSDMLRFSGYDVIMTREDDRLLYDRNADFKGHKKSLDLKARLDIAKNNPDHVMISIHMNSFGSPKYSGLQVYYSKNNGSSRELAGYIQDTVKNTLQNENNRKIKPAGSSIYLLDRAENTAVLVECGFLSNADECEKLSHPSYRKSLAFSLLGAVGEYFDNYTGER